jgi:hypothetical protein
MCNTHISCVMFRVAGENTKHSPKYQITQTFWKSGSGSFVYAFFSFVKWTGTQMFLGWVSCPAARRQHWQSWFAQAKYWSVLLHPTAGNSSLGKSSHCCPDRCDRRLFRVIIMDIVLICFVWSPLTLSFCSWRDASQDSRIISFFCFIRLRIPGDNTITWPTT